MSELDLEGRIRNRNSWVRVVTSLALLVIAAWKVLPAQITIADLRVTDLLAFLLSLFAIGLSVAFYFKATDTSNQFYDNTYKFTKEVSEILGRIEAGFGERLRHLDEGYSGLRDSVAKLPLDRKAASQALNEEEATAKELEKQRNDILAQLADRAKLQEKEREDFFRRLTEKEQEVRQARAEVASLHSQLDEATGAPASSADKRDNVLRRMQMYIADPKQRDRLVVAGRPLTLAGVSENFAIIVEDLHPAFVDDMRDMGFLDKSTRLTVAGARWLRGILLHGPHGA